MPSRSASPPPTLADVAAAAGVSTATASRALSGRGSASSHARTEVLRAAAALGYVPNPLAVSLARRRGHRIVIGFVATHEWMLADQYASRVISAAARTAGEHGAGVSAAWIRPGDATGLADLAGDRSVLGVLLVNHSRGLLDAAPAGLRGRIAVIGPGFDRVPSHDVDTPSAMRASLRHLVTGGRRRIAMLTGPAWVPSMRRPYAAYRDGMAGHGWPVRTVAGGLSTASGRAGAVAALRRWPDLDAVVASTDLTALGVLEALADSGRRVPDDVAVIGFDDVPLAQLGRPPLTTATHPVEQIVAGAVGTLLSGGADPGLAVVHRSALVPRRSA
ncbi:LacI family DNA-binding transcriptional regulator [Mangrovihabitans endophyticus]|uniref:LacI family transcriptional regulator n=1 Tax=Mangrovihabitans endophyticus TaxID=1751298 RepID=A0A8J3C0L2_9ACTN|nr:LacI family DNA-binding transcriptional regulator [Mangrovihabitans endophyticus]GGL00415.1 LacI family transcriptional regulator [Mangrovihabitans endophyticus]